MNRFTNVISFLPDCQAYTLSPSSLAGWYVLYPPTDTVNLIEPSLIYFDPISPSYIGWTTTIPLSCQGHSNYLLGKCELIYQCLDPAKRGMKDMNGEYKPPVGKDMIDCAGRVLRGKVENKLTSYELFCIFTDYTQCKPWRDNQPAPFLPTEFLDWSIGLITYGKTLATTNVPVKVFGQYVKAVIRDIGNFNNYQQNLIPHTVSLNGFELPEVGIGAAQTPANFTYIVGVLTFSNLDNPSEIKIVFPEQIFGNIPDSPGRYLTISESTITINSNQPSFTVDLNNLVFLTPVNDFTIYIGNQKHIQPF